MRPVLLQALKSHLRILCAGLLAASVIAGSAFLVQPVWAQAYPTKPVTYLVTFDPGGQSDREARRQQPHLERLLGQKILIDYKVGGGGALGWRELVKSKPDGYLMAGINMPHIILQPLQQEVGYKTEQIVPVSLFQRTILALAVLNTSQFKTLEEFIEYAKKNPGALTVGGSGTYSGPHMASLRFEKLAKSPITYVPFTGAAPQTMAFLGGHTAAAFSNSDDLVRYKDKVRVLAFAGETRFPDFPDAPTFREKGIDMLEAVDRGIAVPPGTPEPVIKRLEAAFLEIAKNPEIQAEMKSQGFVPLALGHAESKAHIEKMAAIYKELVAGLKK